MVAIPALPSDLRPLGPYLQRSAEVKQQDPVMSYWCKYYAVQLGLGVKSKDKDPERTKVLGTLLTELETARQELADNQIIGDTEASVAYIENYGLRVFANADSEDRRGVATKTTARKFLAAANFLELLKIFDKTDPENVEKIRYAKWKAAEISKAFREGRKPTPGPAGGSQSPDLTVSGSSTLVPPLSDASGSPPASIVNSPGTKERRLSSSHSVSPPSGGIVAPPEHIQIAPSTPESSSRRLPPHFIDPKLTPRSPGVWSTVATPGLEDGPFVSDDSPLKGRTGVKDSFNEEDWSNAASYTTSRQNSYTRDSTVDPTVFGPSAGILPPLAPAPEHIDEHTVTLDDAPAAPRAKKVRWTPSVTGGSSVASSSPPESPTGGFSVSLPSVPEDTDRPSPPPRGVVIPHELSLPDSPPHSVVSSDPASLGGDGFSGARVPSPPKQQPGTFIPPVPPRFQYIPPSAPLAPPVYPQALGPSPAIQSPPPRQAEAAPAARPVELTHSLVAKIQKHCRFAISSLDYEDADQARKELRAALALLGE
ncbi:DUF605-domain-containing protein [Sistotremastrum suecicum HHB10207 ss-3]|uniref:DUF605-domain-containing protein n=1 Tax=Sistotremastrum suecicum HHB10207 ss-3 TaxID=1314776 RepID=A0A166JBQ1_9AGAM|nr:DUF605-domain-containing protein [Sistotremastrum suecicum HHB10207 ss-3]